MIVYLLKSAICLSVFLAVYHLLFEDMKMHKFNRFYLLSSLVIGLSLPLITIEVPTETLIHTPILASTITKQQTPDLIQPALKQNTAINAAAPTYNLATLLILFYGLIAVGFALRFARNLLIIWSRIKKNPKREINGTPLVLLPNDVLPHSFLGHIFLNEDDYYGNKIKQQLLEHELIHVRQKHSLDILFIEALKIAFWFNPVFLFYKKAMQLNHEFLADDAVLKKYEASEYQYLLLASTMTMPNISLTSNLNFSLTKKRLTMMTKTTSKLKSWTARLALVPVLAAMLFLFSMKSVSDAAKPKPTARDYHSKVVENPDRETFFKGATIWIENKDGKYMPKKYEEMTAAEKAALPMPMLPKNTPTNEELAAWETQPHVYAICINNKWVDNSELKKYKREDFVHYGVRKPGKIDLRVNKNYGKASHLVDLLTENQFQKEFVAPYIQPGKWLGIYKGKIWPGGFDGSGLINKYFEVEELKNANPGYDKRWLLPPFKPEKIQ